MISDFTREQLSALEVPASKPLIICDVDDVVVHFLRGFDTYLAARNHYFNAKSFALHGNVLHSKTHAEMPPDDISQLIDDYFNDMTEHMDAIDGAVTSLTSLSHRATVVMLTNLPHHARDKRIKNLRGHGLPFPVITNSGPKGPAIRHLAGLTTAPVVFIDDSPGFVQSSYDHAPDVKIIHFLHDPRIARLHKPFDFVSLTAESWERVKPHIENLI
jgi:FMN phosphatase YigB (HAD superfamily)